MTDLRSPYDLPTPCLLIDRDLALANIRMMQQKADALGLRLRPHIKTHRMPWFAKRQLEAGACGLACAKLGEAEVMADNGMTDLFIANELIGLDKYERLRALTHRAHVRVGIDNEYQLRQMEQVFAWEEKPLEVLIEYEVGEMRSGVASEERLIELVRAISDAKHVVLKGVFSHEGHTYRAETAADCVRQAGEAHRKTARAADIMRELGAEIDTVSIGATPSVMQMDAFPGITELRIGTYIFFDVGQSRAMGDFSRCAATVLASVISQPEGDRTVLDAGAKALVSQNRPTGICSTKGFGAVKGAEHINIETLYDEHAVLNSHELLTRARVGDKLEIIPSHICPTVNLYDEAYLVSQGEVLQKLPIACRGRSV